MTKTLIFDFDGTIADSVEIFVESLLVAIGRQENFSEEEMNDLSNSSIKEIIKKLGIRKWQLAKVLIKGRSEITKRMDRVSPFKNIDVVFKELSDSGFKIFILSTNSEKNIKEFINKFGLGDYISAVYADIGLFGKVKWIRKIVKQNKLVPGDCVYIGDETRDIEAAKKAGVRPIAVAWGYSNPETLKKYNPDHLVDTPRQLLKVIKNI